VDHLATNDDTRAWIVVGLDLLIQSSSMEGGMVEPDHRRGENDPHQDLVARSREEKQRATSGGKPRSSRSLVIIALNPGIFRSRRSIIRIRLHDSFEGPGGRRMHPDRPEPSQQNVLVHESASAMNAELAARYGRRPYHEN